MPKRILLNYTFLLLSFSVFLFTIACSISETKGEKSIIVGKVEEKTKISRWEEFVMGKSIYVLTFPVFASGLLMERPLDTLIKEEINNCGIMLTTDKIFNADFILSGNIENFTEVIKVVGENVLYRAELILNFRLKYRPEDLLVLDQKLREVMISTLELKGEEIKSFILEKVDLRKELHKKLIKMSAKHLAQICSYGWQLDYGPFTKYPKPLLGGEITNEYYEEGTEIRRTSETNIPVIGGEQRR